ncbi:mast cell protease 3-like [Xiphophorus maculatus]|uniref:Mast cell protease 3-like n=1 Tax=Xiphophorus maculatus TaxID=8083 RepID=M4ADK9_XIPMA|nr:mast cell protease 3-like [Xiphophorus maculatus]
MTFGFILLLLCAFRGAEGTRIVGGKDAVPHSRPYMVSLQIQRQHICGGVLIREDFVLTAAHCDIMVPFTVVLGADTLKANEPAKQSLRVLRSFPHPDYTDLTNDIMLLKLSSRANLTKEVQLISLKSGSLRTGSRCITAGWGDISDNRTLANRLQEVNVTIMSPTTCQRRWGEVPIERTMVCAMGSRNRQGFCSGDSGGPLVCDGASAGVVSFSGRRCGNIRTPDVYTRVDSFRQWIEKVLNEN